MVSFTGVFLLVCPVWLPEIALAALSRSVIPFVLVMVAAQALVMIFSSTRAVAAGAALREVRTGHAIGWVDRD